MHPTRVLLAASLVCCAFAPAPLAAQAAAAAPAPSIWPERPISTGMVGSRGAEVRIGASAAARRPQWVLPLIGAVSGATIFHVVFHEPCDDCMIHIPAALVGASLGAAVGTVFEVFRGGP